MTERSDLQQLIFQNPEEFFERECGEHLFLLAQEVCPSTKVADRVDLLAIDDEGKTVVIELKRGNHKLQLLQSLSYAAMLSLEMVGWTAFRALVSPSRSEAFDAFLRANNNRIGQREANTSQRIILIAESYDYEVLQTARWLTENHGLNITCYEIALALDEAKQTEYLSAMQLYPPKRLADQARQRGAQRSQEENRFPTLEERLISCTNPVVRKFFEDWLALNPTRNRRQDSIVLPSVGKVRFRSTSRRGYARITQLGRFVGDEKKWSVIAPGTVKLRKTPEGLRFRLSTKEGLEAFRAFAEKELSSIKWNTKVDSDADFEEEDDAE